MKKKLCAIMLFFLVGYYGIAGAEWYFWLDDEKYPHKDNGESIHNYSATAFNKRSVSEFDETDCPFN